jgi:carboxyl-terminal processing protease
VTPTLTVTLQPQPLKMPLAVLIDESSASASELLAAVLQDRGRARVFGVPSCGCLLGARGGGLEIPGGGRLMMSQFDMRIGATPGKRIEGVGVQPDAPVPWTVGALQGQRDVVFDAAQAWLMGPGGTASP